MRAPLICVLETREGTPGGLVLSLSLERAGMERAGDPGMRHPGNERLMRKTLGKTWRTFLHATCEKERGAQRGAAQLSERRAARKRDGERLRRRRGVRA